MSLKINVSREICSKVFDPLYVENIWRILVLDEYTTQIMSKILKMHDLFDKGITLVDDLNKKREPVPMEAIYLISPKRNKIEIMINDFTSSPTYLCAHVFFTDECSTEDLNLIGESVIANYIVSLKEININFLLDESQIFHFDFKLEEDIYESFDELGHEKAWEMARAIASMCEILNENPSIYFQTTEKAQRFAIKVQQEMAKISLDNPNLGHAIHKDQSILLILDRSIDPLTPLLHDLHLQCLAYDILDIDRDIFSYKNQETEKVSFVDLSENDPLWIQLRHMHIADASRILPLKLKQLASAQKCIDGATESSDSTYKSTNPENVTKQLRIMMKKMPHLRQEAVSVSNMFYLSEACLSAFQAGVNQLCECEQNLVIGTDASGDPIKNPENLVINVINNTMATMSEKLRLLLILLISQSGMYESRLMELVQKLRIDDRCKDMFEGIRSLGDFIWSKENPTLKAISKRFPFLIGNRKNVIDSSSYTLSRWVPFMKDVVVSCIRGQINPNMILKIDQLKLFPEYLQPENNGYSMPQRQSWSKLQDTDNHVGPRLIVFVLGGISLAESRVAYDVTKLCYAMRSGNISEQTKKNSSLWFENGGGRGWNWEVVLGGTNILTPEKYLDFLSKTKEH